jgi:hypothetical protein
MTEADLLADRSASNLSSAALVVQYIHAILWFCAALKWTIIARSSAA